MYFYEVFASSARYHSADSLTYSSEDDLSIGAIVSIPLGKLTTIGMVVQKTSKPSFDVKAILSLIHPLPMPSTLLELHGWLQEYYPAPSGMLTQLFIPNSLQSKPNHKPQYEEFSMIKDALPELTAEQQRAVSSIQKATASSFLLHGETGSGKTRVYLELAKESLHNGKSAIILTPEIGLTPQLALAFDQAFPGAVVTVHSGQTQAQRRDTWLRIHENDGPLVVIGPRSALFAPIRNLGLIVVDEAHDTAYKQEQAPYYQATRVAAKLASLSGSKVILGSSTPLIQDYFAFKSKGLPIIRMEQQAKNTQTTTDIQLLDMTKRENFSRSAWLSDALIAAIKSSLSSGGQVLLFLNRRGTARLVLCASCGWQSLCPHCDIPLTYHGDTHSLRCHTCGFRTSATSSCPECGSTEIQFRSVGTKTIASEAEKLFPEARIQRFDTDNKKSERLVEHYTSLSEGKIDILVGTQLLGKGLDLPELAVVGVINADTSLSFPDYTAEERTFQMLRQVIGRVGRGHKNSTVVVQTFHPKRESIVAATDRKYESFYETELAERQLYHFPPFYFVLKVHFDRATQNSAMSAAQKTLSSLLHAGIKVEASGPAPAFTERVGGKYRWQIIFKSKTRTELTKAISMLPSNCTYDIDPSDLL